MSRVGAAVVLVALGLAVGLWLGFDPRAHAAVEKNWSTAQTSIAQIQEQFGARLQGNTPSTPEVAQKANGESQTQSPLDKLPSAFQAFWRAAQQVWFSLLGRLNIPR